MTWHKIVIDDSREMSRVEDNSVHLIVTSPPYFNARDYKISNQIGFGSSLDDYINSLSVVFRECYRILRPGRKFCLNISDLPTKGKYGVKWIPLGPLLLNTCLNLEFELVDRIIWQKVPMKGFNYGSLPYPPSPLICDSMEYIYILRKKGMNDYSYLSLRDKKKSKLTPEEYKSMTKQIWSIKRVRRNENINGHISPFPDELPKRCIKLYSFVNDVILDPFGGRGTTTKAAIETERNSILYEINEDYLPLIKEYIRSKQKTLDMNLRFEFFNDTLKR